ncbi:hypothetical protein MTO96_000503 [Rhipicephalus appendiculatus]
MRLRNAAGWPCAVGVVLLTSQDWDNVGTAVAAAKQEAALTGGAALVVRGVAGLVHCFNGTDDAPARATMQMSSSSMDTSDVTGVCTLESVLKVQLSIPSLAHLHLTGQKKEHYKTSKKHTELEFMIEVVEKNAYLEGRVRELAKVKPAEARTFAEVTRTNTGNKVQDGEKGSTSSERKAVLLVRAPEDEEETSSGEVREKLVRHFDPVALGLKDVGLRSIRGGVAVTTTSATTIKKLKGRIMEHDQTKKLETKIVDAAEPEIRLISVDKHVDSKDIPKILPEQNEIEGAEEDIKVVWRTDR